jgi:glycosyltransferase involved in cell wall biosynthesis
MAVLVSINCTAYNQEGYISKAIDSFLMQKTDFGYEVLIGEDCSNDSTRKIAFGYAEKYPDIVRVITYEKNLGSVKNSIRLIEESQGKYVAICEGDDYWTDVYKLQKQVDFMIGHPECSMCYHDAEIYNVMKSRSEGTVRPYKKTCILPSGKLFFGGGHEVPTASIMFVKNYLNTIPPLMARSPVMDHPLALILSYHGKVGYIDEVMAARSLWVPDSWNTRFFSDNGVDKKIEHIKAMISLLNEYDAYSKNKYTMQIKKRIFAGEMEIMKLQGKAPFQDQRLLGLYRSFNTIDRFKISVSRMLPKLSEKYVNIKKAVASAFICRTK